MPIDQHCHVGTIRIAPFEFRVKDVLWSYIARSCKQCITKWWAFSELAISCMIKYTRHSFLTVDQLLLLLPTEFQSIPRPETIFPHFEFGSA